MKEDPSIVFTKNITDSIHWTPRDFIRREDPLWILLIGMWSLWMGRCWGWRGRRRWSIRRRRGWRKIGGGLWRGRRAVWRVWGGKKWGYVVLEQVMGRSAKIIPILPNLAASCRTTLYCRRAEYEQTGKSSTTKYRNYSTYGNSKCKHRWRKLLFLSSINLKRRRRTGLVWNF